MIPTPYYEDDGVTLYHGDAIEVLPGLAEQFDIVLTDPPYTFGLASTASEGKAGAWPDLMNNAFWYAHWLGMAQGLTRARQGSVWIFNSWRSFPVIARAASMIGWGIESLLVWDKQWIGPGGTRGLRPSYELVALLCHPGFQVADRGTPDIWREQWSSRKPNGHPAEKPLGLCRRILEAPGKDRVKVGDPTREPAWSVLDPFCGSGTTLVAAKQAGLRAVGVESEERWCDVTAERLSQSVLLAEDHPNPTRGPLLRGP